jgi:spore coat polysaccharide biosynthesis protein SpsF|tara:strand:+ start:759 stop:1352 length:594 start_codon:yes stop_codon:yes gene_type:complete
MKTIQEKTWKGKFGVNYSIRNKGIKKNFLRKIIDKKIKIKSVFEFGTNIGNNLDIIKSINKNTLTSGVEINQFASEIARKKGHKIINKSIFELENAKKKFDLTMTIGVLIHVNPHQLKFIYKKLFEYSKKYILICEYFNDKPVTIKYRGKFNLLFKRDFAKEIKDKYNLKIVDYGFVWSEDKNYNMDNYNWFLLKKK